MDMILLVILLVVEVCLCCGLVGYGRARTQMSPSSVVYDVE
jgi:hypothetical protein